MLERDGELAALDAVLAEMGAVVVVRGPAGIGRSTLGRAARAPARMLHGPAGDRRRLRAFAKLGISSRTELPDALLR